jgi:hypothetical protein
MKPFISQEISFFNVPHYYILKLGLGGKCTAQYKLRSGTPHLLPREPSDARELVRVTSCLVADDFAFVDGKLELLKFMDCDITDREAYSTGQMATAIALEGCMDIFKKLQTETFQLMDMKARLESNTEDEIDGPSFSYEDLKRASSDKYGYICFLKDSAEGPFRIPVIPPIIYGDEVYGGNAAQRARTEKGAAKIFAAKCSKRFRSIPLKSVLLLLFLRSGFHHPLYTSTKSTTFPSSELKKISLQPPQQKPKVLPHGVQG